MKFILFAIFGILASGCATTSISLQVMVPAQIHIPSDIKKVVVVNRSLPEKQQQKWNVLEGFITGESVFADQEGSKNCLDGLIGKLRQTSRFEAVLDDVFELNGTGTRSFAEPLSWDKVNAVCAYYKADALVCLETFDSNIKLEEGKVTTNHKVEGKDVPVTEFVSDLHINVRAGWRIYDNKARVVVDENAFTDEQGWGGKGPTPMKALSALPNKRLAINEAGYFAGKQYGIRISPNWIWTPRMYYKKGDRDFEKATRYAKTKEWKNAAGIWSKSTQSSDPEVAGRACYNMALANEIEGSLDVALEWASKAYHDYNNKKARAYVHTIKGRINDQLRLNNQLGQ